MKAFFDANVFFAGIDNPSGGSGLLLALYGQKRLFELITTDYVISEAAKNIRAKLGLEKFSDFRNFLDSCAPAIIALPLTLEVLGFYAKFVVVKDAPVIAGAHKLEADYLVTLDKRHLLTKARIIETVFDFKVITPGIFLEKLLA